MEVIELRQFLKVLVYGNFGMVYTAQKVFKVQLAARGERGEESARE